MSTSVRFPWVYQAASSNPGRYYRVTLLSSQLGRCECLGYRNRNTCRHLKAAFWEYSQQREAVLKACPPGSPQAVREGCLCAVMDNAHGAGYLGSGTWVITVGCPLHAPGGAEAIEPGETFEVEL